ncbi:branched-chain amino acid transporter AzlD [Aeromicrobium sp. PE09-221]|uniref:AzlD domain-containing protein n=1 Tax=Aeromicrobium sp. PE09-221 TaxID=1898043 RepID=UPI000B3E7066|nr:AzlD domain-containing protein [Aeromicrobium sp. PE09-221]OUZ07975.1 branched-chain amino acid transporter AzlD [Aeromicrobium sp. PE09-221]
MTELWIGLLLTAAGCYVLKLAGLSLPARVLDHPWTVRAAALIPVALLGALVAVQVVGDGSALTIDARMLALVVAGVLLWWRMPFLVVVGAAAASAAFLRLLT